MSVPHPDLEPFPLPRALASLPPSHLAEFARLYELVKGYVASLPKTQEHNEAVLATISREVSKIEDIRQMLRKHSDVSERITLQLAQLDRLVTQFGVLETQQYQLLSQFSSATQRQRLAKVVARDKCPAYNGEEVGQFLEQFRQRRKAFHVRNHKLQRWLEERVSGFV